MRYIEELLSPPEDRDHHERTASAIGDLAVSYASDFDVIAVVAEQHAMILSAEAVERRLDALQALDVAFFGF